MVLQAVWKANLTTQDAWLILKIRLSHRFRRKILQKTMQQYNIEGNHSDCKWQSEWINLNAFMGKIYLQLNPIQVKSDGNLSQPNTTKWEMRTYILVCIVCSRMGFTLFRFIDKSIFWQ